MSEVIYACDTDGSVNVWEHGHLSVRKMRGKALSQLRVLSDEAGLEALDILRGKVVHGWVLTIDGVGDWSGCSADWVTYFEREEPEVVDGKWLGHTVTHYDEETDEEDETPATVVDGPHEATWLEVST